MSPTINKGHVSLYLSDCPQWLFISRPVFPWRAVCVRDLMEKAKFSPSDALACGKRQALAVLAKFKKKVAS